MSSAPPAEEQITLPVVVDFPVADAAIAEWSQVFMALHVADVNDKEGLADVREARLLIKGKRVEVEKKRKQLVEKAVKYQKLVNGEAKRLTALIEPIETHLQYEEDTVCREQERLRQEAETMRRKTIDDRIKAVELLVFPCMQPPYNVIVEDIGKIDAEEFKSLTVSLTEQKRQHDERIIAEQVERNRLEAQIAREREQLARDRQQQEQAAAAERARLDEQRREQAAVQAKIDAEKKRIADETLERKRQGELELAKREAAQQALLRAEEQRRRDEAVAQQIEVERLRLEALLPDRERIILFAATIEALVVPELPAAHVEDRIQHVLQTAGARIREIAEGL